MCISPHILLGCLWFLCGGKLLADTVLSDALTLYALWKRQGEHHQLASGSLTPLG
jgi:hypothetical protein